MDRKLGRGTEREERERERERENRQTDRQTDRQTERERKQVITKPEQLPTAGRHGGQQPKPQHRQIPGLPLQEVWCTFV